MGQPAARLTDMHTCPMVTGVVPHVGGPIVAPGAPTVLIGDLPAARVTDECICVGPPDIIVMGAFTVLISGLPAARLGDMTAHGGVIVLGDFTVLIGEAGDSDSDDDGDEDEDEPPEETEPDQAEDDEQSYDRDASDDQTQQPADNSQQMEELHATQYKLDGTAATPEEQAGSDLGSAVGNPAGDGPAAGDAASDPASGATLQGNVQDAGPGTPSAGVSVDSGLPSPGALQGGVGALGGTGTGTPPQAPSSSPRVLTGGVETRQQRTPTPIPARPSTPPATRSVPSHAVSTRSTSLKGGAQKTVVQPKQPMSAAKPKTDPTSLTAPPNWALPKNVEFAPGQTPEFQTSMKNALYQISVTKTGKMIFDGIASTPHKVIMQAWTSKNGEAFPTNKGDAAVKPATLVDKVFGQPDLRPNRGSDVVLKYNPSILEGKPAVVVGHELIHALHMTRGIWDFRSGGGGIMKEEFQTVGLQQSLTPGITENALRQDLGLPARGDYRGLKE